MLRNKQAPPVAAGGFALVALASALWGTDALFRRGLALELPAASVVFAEHLVLVLLCAALWRRAFRAARLLDYRDWIAVILIGVGASAVATALFTAAFQYGDPTTPLLLQKLQPAIAILGAHLLLGERLLPRYGLYFALAACGAYLITFPDATQVSAGRLTPALFALGAATLWAVGTVLGRGMTTRLDVPTLTTLRFGVGLPASAVVVLVVEGPDGYTVYAPRDILPLLLLALIPGLLAILLYYRGLSRVPAAAATLAELTFPLSAVLIGYLDFDDALSGTQWVGVVVLSVTIATMSLLGHRESRPFGVNVPREDVTHQRLPTPSGVSEPSRLGGRVGPDPPAG
jgi:drug/metabolite transporter (DMT)-like permease